MAGKKSTISPRLSLDEFRIQISKFNKRKHTTTLSHTFERDAIKSALTRLDPYISEIDANLHANIIMQQRLSSPCVSKADIATAVKLQNKQFRHIFFPVEFTAKFS